MDVIFIVNLLKNNYSYLWNMQFVIETFAVKPSRNPLLTKDVDRILNNNTNYILPEIHNLGLSRSEVHPIQIAQTYIL